MMKLSTMLAVVGTVDENRRSPLADIVLARWEHDGAEGGKFWRASANFVFVFSRMGRRCFLRFNHAGERTAEAIEGEIDFIGRLRAKGINAARPVRSIAGRYVETVAVGSGLYHAVVFEELPGEQVDLASCTAARFVGWGEALGGLHNATGSIAAAGRPDWRDHLELVSENLPAAEAAAWRALERLGRQLEELPEDGESVGMIHFDFELDNILWDGERAGVIDFDDSARYWFAADIAFALRDVFGDRAAGVDPDHEGYRLFVEGYRRVRPLAEEELRWVPLFLRWHNLLTFARLQRALTPVNPAGEPPWMGGLREKLAAKLAFYRRGFAPD